MLHSMVQTQQADRAGTAVLSKLKSVLHEEPASPYEKQQRKSQIARTRLESRNNAESCHSYGTRWAQS